MSSDSEGLRLTLQAECAPLPRAALARRTDEFSSRNGWSRQQFLAFQHDRLTAALTWAVERSDYYASTIGPLLARGARLQNLPTLTKSQFMANFDAIVTDSRLTCKMIGAHVDGPDAGTPLLGIYRAMATGGTSGERAVFVYDEEAWLSVMAVIGRAQRILGIAAETRSLGIGAPSPVHASNRFYIEARASRPLSPRLDVTMPVAEIVTALNTYQPEAITTYPSFMRVLAREQQAGRLSIAPRLFRSGAETLLPEVVELVEETWGVPVYNGYASTEAGLMGFDCPHRNGLHIAEDHLVYEVIGDNGQPVADGEEGHKCLITTLNNPVLPLIRYELSDMVTLSQSPCACGLPFARVTSIKGRREETLSFPGRHGGFVELGAIVLKSPLIATAGVEWFQISGNGSALEVRVVPSHGIDVIELQTRVASTLRQKLVDHGALLPPITVEVVSEIPRVGPAAKEKQFVRRD